MRDLDTKKFLATLVREIANEKLHSGPRQMACTIMKNFIHKKPSPPKYRSSPRVKLLLAKPRTSLGFPTPKNGKMFTKISQKG